MCMIINIIEIIKGTLPVLKEPNKKKEKLPVLKESPKVSDQIKKQQQSQKMKYKNDQHDY